MNVTQRRPACLPRASTIHITPDPVRAKSGLAGINWGAMNLARVRGFALENADFEIF
jgi:hypothetical protein